MCLKETTKLHYSIQEGIYMRVWPIHAVNLIQTQKYSGATTFS